MSHCTGRHGQQTPLRPVQKNISRIKDVLQNLSTAGNVVVDPELDIIYCESMHVLFRAQIICWMGSNIDADCVVLVVEGL